MECSRYGGWAMKRYAKDAVQKQRGRIGDFERVSTVPLWLGLVYADKRGRVMQSFSCRAHIKNRASLVLGCFCGAIQG
eukprot:scaffold10106_cov196-Skeletonema_marinoi.AAC.1